MCTIARRNCCKFHAKPKNLLKNNHEAMQLYHKQFVFKALSKN